MRCTPHRLAVAPLAALVLPVFAPGAAANIPDPITKSNTVRAPTIGSPANGTLTTRVVYTGTTATATAATSDPIRLRKGFSYRLRTCVAYHLYASAPVSSCAERDVD